MQNLSHLAVLIHEQAKTYGDREVLIYKDFGGMEWKSYSWNQFSQTVTQVSNALLNLGVKVQENVGIFSQNSAPYLFCDFGAWGIRAVTIPFYATSSEQQIQFMITDAKIRILFVGEQEQYDKAHRVQATCHTLERIIVFDRGVRLNEEDKLAMYKQWYDEAPFADEIVPTTLEISDCQNADETAKKYPGVKVETMVNGEHWRLSARTSAEDPMASYLEASRGDIWIDYQQPLDAPYGVQMTREEAIRQATAFVQRVAGNEYSVCYCVPLMAHPDFQESSGDTPVATLPKRFSQWGLVFMRTFNGCPSAYAHEEVGSDMDTTVSKPIHYERMELHIDDQGVSYFRWNTPMKVTGVVNASARLISFDEAAKNAMSQVAARWKYDAERDKENGKEITIYMQRVTFGLWRIQKKGGGFYYVPVYHFFSEANANDWADWVQNNPYDADYLGISMNTTWREAFLYCMEKEEYRWLLLSYCRTFGGDYWGGVTVNALDGTIIDKDKGY